MIYVISDTHFGHRMLDKYRPQYFEEIIIEYWNETVTPLDTVIHLGDFALGKFSDYSIRQSIIKWRNRLKGNIILVRGNHDDIKLDKYLGCFQMICDSFDIKYYGKNIHFSHKPKDLDWLKYDLNIHGHIHSDMRKEEIKDFNYIPGKHINVAVEFTKYKPILLKSLIN